jgi:hypothetical protein
MLWLALFNDAEHYQSVRRKGDNERAPAEIEDKLAIPHEADKSEAAKIQRGEIVPPTADKGDKGQSSLVTQVLASLPPLHSHSQEYITGILARVKGDVGEAVEILLEEIEGDDNSDWHVEDMLVDQDSGQPSTPSPIRAGSAATPITILLSSASSSAYRDPSPAKSSSPIVPNSPSGSSTTTLSDSSRSSKMTTPSTRSSHSVSRSKPYARPVKKEELAKELDELTVVGDGASHVEKLRQSKREVEVRKETLGRLRAPREKAKTRTVS